MDGRTTLLLIEDDDWARYALGRILELRGFEVRTAATLGEGLELLERGPDCVILDLRLPDGDGEEVLRRVREAQLASRVLVCSAVADSEKRGELEELRPDAIFQKPVEIEEIVAAFSPQR